MKRWRKKKLPLDVIPRELTGSVCHYLCEGHAGMLRLLLGEGPSHRGANASYVKWLSHVLPVLGHMTSVLRAFVVN